VEKTDPSFKIGLDFFIPPFSPISDIGKKKPSYSFILLPLPLIILFKINFLQ